MKVDPVKNFYKCADFNGGQQKLDYIKAKSQQNKENVNLVNIKQIENYLHRLS